MPTMDDVARRERLFADDRVARLPRFRVDQEGDARPHPRRSPRRSAITTTRRPRASPRSGSRAFGIILPTLQDSIYLPFVEGAREVFERERRRLPPADASTMPAGASRTPSARSCRSGSRRSCCRRSATRRRPEGCCESLPIPLIEVGNLPKRPIHFAVGHSDFDAGYLATRRLIESGRRQIAIICGHVARHLERPRPARTAIARR